MRKLICLVKSRTGIAPTSVRVAIRFDPVDSGLAAANAYPTGSGSPPVGNGIIVCAATLARSRSGFYGTLLAGKYLTSKITTRIERASGVEELAANEADPTGRNWSWCVP